MFSKVMSIVAPALLLAGCMNPYGEVVARKAVNLSAAQRKSVEQAVAYSLRDPASAQFRAMQAVEASYESGMRTIAVCGEINGKNGFGGYVGFQAFAGQFDETGAFALQGMDEPTAYGPTTIWRSYCATQFGIRFHSPG